MQVSKIRALRGPNLWTRHTAIEAIVSCSAEELDSKAFAHFQVAVQRLFGQVPDIKALKADEPATMAHAFEKIALGLQIEAGCVVTFSRTTATTESGVYQVVVEYSEEDVGRLAFEMAEQICEAARSGSAFDTAHAIGQLHELDESVRMGPSTGSIVNAAVARGIPYRRLTQGSLVQLGWGHKQRRIQAAELDSTSAISEEIAQDKSLTKHLLQAAGVPVPVGYPVDSLEHGWQVAERLGLPVVVKPQDGNQGKGVSVNIQTRPAFDAAYASAERYGDVLVEKFLPGADYRLLVIGGRLVAAARREPPLVIGDGVKTVRALVEAVNADPRRGDGHSTSLTRIRFDDIALGCLAEQGLQAESVPEKGRRVVLRNNANLSTGGSATDVTDEVHSEVADRAIAAAQMVGVDICGVDVVCENVQRPLEEQNGGIVEVNAAPGLRMHISPSFGKGRAIGQAIIDHVYPPGDDGRIPVIAVTGTNGKTTTVRLITHLLRSQGLSVGMTNTDGVYINGQQIDSGDCSGPRSARNVLMHPEVEAAVLETARGGMLREGLGFDQCTVAVVTNVGSGDHLGLNYITTLEDLKVLKRVIVLNVASSGTAVLNAEDPAVVAMAPHCPGRVCFFSLDPHCGVLAKHRTQGQRVVTVEQGQIVAQEGAFVHRISLSQVPMTMDGKIDFQTQNVLASVAAAWAVATPWPAIEQGLATFNSDAHAVPGRFNLFQYRGATVIADYGHNPDAIAALTQAVSALPAKKRSVVISGAGDRRDEDIRDQTRILGNAFDEVILYQDACQRGRADGEVVGLLREGLASASRTTSVKEIQGEFLAIDTALQGLSTGDLCLVLVDQVQESLAYLRAKISN